MRVPFGNRKITDGLLALLTENDGLGSGVGQDCWSGIEDEYGPGVYAQLLYMLTRLEFDQDEAKACWLDICRHESEMSAALGRSVGLRAALCDYFLNIQRKVRNPVIVEIQLFLQRERHALRDELTGLYNRRHFNCEIEKELERYKRFGHPFSLLMIDIDHFKNFNDSHGHQAGDAALIKLAEVLQDTARLIDTVARYGGEEFVAILPQTGKEQAQAAAERFLQALRRRCRIDFGGRCVGAITASIGVATFPDDAMTAEALMARADEALYRAKREGRNRVYVYTDQRRKHPRYPVSMSLAVRSFGSDDEFIHCEVRDMSLGGVLCESRAPVSRGELLEVELGATRDGQSVPMNATAVRITKDVDNPHVYHLALSFMVESPEYRQSIVNMVDVGRQADTPLA